MNDRFLHRRFQNFLRKHKGCRFKAEDFRAACGDYTPEEGWQSAMTSLITEARAAGLIKSCGVTRDKFRSYKTRWKVAA